MKSRNARLSVAVFFLGLFLCPQCVFAGPLESLKDQNFLQGLDPRSFLGVDINNETPAFPRTFTILPSGGEAGSWRRDLKAYFISVGQGDSEYIELPNGKNVLIDGGPRDSSGADEPSIAQFLTRRGITKIDYVVLTHPHSDHYNGLRYVFDHMRVKHFYDTRIENPNNSSLKALRE